MARYLVDHPNIKAKKEMVAMSPGNIVVDKILDEHKTLNPDMYRDVEQVGGSDDKFLAATMLKKTYNALCFVFLVPVFTWAALRRMQIWYETSIADNIIITVPDTEGMKYGKSVKIEPSEYMKYAIWFERQPLLQDVNIKGLLALKVRTVVTRAAKAQLRSLDQTVRPASEHDNNKKKQGLLSPGF